MKQASTHGYVDPHTIERMWKEQFDYFYREHDSFVFPMSIHPQVSGKPQVILMHERIIEYINQHEGVEWCTFEQMVEEFKEGRITGAEVKGGVE
jgi:peptidoglycan/xylan/chitin deacetylase (PgdA/CDA1 family)